MLLLASMAVVITSCSNQPAASTATATPAADTSTVTEKIDYAYTPSNHAPDNWDRGDQKNVALVLKSLKAFADGKVDESLQSFADSVYWVSDEGEGKYSKDQIKKMFTDGWSKMSSIKIMMEDYESVVSKDKKDNFVSLWYKQITTTKSGKIDSVYHMDDLKIDNGKIVLLDEKTRKYVVHKK
jgi:hypothetical protein